MTEIVLRPASRADVPALADLARRCFVATYAASHDAGRIRIHCGTMLSDPAVSAWFDDTDAHVTVATRDGTLLGYVQWQRAAAPIPARFPVELKRLYVDPEAIGNGLGQRLFEHVRDDAHAEGADLLWLCVYAGNTRARRFYAKQGLSEIGHVPYAFVDQVEDDLALGLHLSSAPP